MFEDLAPTLEAHIISKRKAGAVVDTPIEKAQAIYAKNFLMNSTKAAQNLGDITEYGQPYGYVVSRTKGKKKPIPVFDFGAGKPAFTTAFLLRAMQIANNSAAKIITYGERKIAVIKSSNGDRIAVCPVAMRPDARRRDCIQEIKKHQITA